MGGVKVRFLVNLLQTLEGREIERNTFPSKKPSIELPSFCWAEPIEKVTLKN